MGDEINHLLLGWMVGYGAAATDKVSTALTGLQAVAFSAHLGYVLNVNSVNDNV